MTTTPADNPAPPAAPSRQAWLIAGSAAAVLFIVLELASDFVAVPLRELSSILAQAILGVIGFPVSRSGTILSTPNARFDVVPACSGSTTLQVLLFLAILWCGVHPKLTPARRIAAILIAMPLALLANAVRVSALVAIGHFQGEEPGDVVHALTGLVVFAGAMFGCYIITDRLATESKRTIVPDRALSWILAALLGFLSLPFLAWCLENWGGSSLDRFGYVFVAAAAALATWGWRRTPENRTHVAHGTVGLGLSMVTLAASTLIDVNILKGLALVLAVGSLGLARKGPRFALSLAPVAIVAYLGFPSVSYQFGAFLSWKFSSLAEFLALKAILAAPLVAIAIVRFRTPGEAAGEPSKLRLLPVQVLLVSALAAFQAYYFGIAATALQELRLEMSYLQGPWIGRDMAPPRSESNYFGSDRIWSRRFTRDRDVLDVLVTSTGGDRHRAHPPAYCVTGEGWVAVETAVAECRLGDGTRVPVTRLRLRRGPETMWFTYWFSNGTEARAGFSGMLLNDTLARLGGRRADWFVFRVMTTSSEAALEEFLAGFQSRLNPRKADPAGSPGGR